MKTSLSHEHGTSATRNPGARSLLLRRACYLAMVLACLISARCYSQTKGPPTNSAPRATPSLAFDEDVGFDNTWAAKKKLTALFKAEGFIMWGQPSTNPPTQNANFIRLGQLSTNGTQAPLRSDPGDEHTVHYAYVPAMYPKPAIYRLSATRGSPGSLVLMSVAGKISADRLSTIKEALREFDSTKTPVLKVQGDFAKRGDFRVRVTQDTVELENLWKATGL